MGNKKKKKWELKITLGSVFHIVGSIMKVP